MQSRKQRKEDKKGWKFWKNVTINKLRTEIKSFTFRNLVNSISYCQRKIGKYWINQLVWTKKRKIGVKKAKNEINRLANSIVQVKNITHLQPSCLQRISLKSFCYANKKLNDCQTTLASQEQSFLPLTGKRYVLKITVQKQTFR